MRFIPLAVLVLAAGILALPLSDARAGDGIELGFDGSFGVQTFDDVGAIEIDEAFSISIPVQSVRAGFPVGEKSQIEPQVSAVYITQGSLDLTQFDLRLHYVYNFQDDEEGEDEGTWPFLYGGGTFSFFDAGSSDGTQFGLGAGGGVKIPAADRFAVRLGADVTRRFENDDFFGSWEIRGLFGFSFFTR